MEAQIKNFGIDQFNRQTMQERLPKPVYQAYIASMHNEGVINRETADSIAHAMKIWAMERGATHFCHWFQPLSGKTAEKHVAFLQPDSSGQPITRLSGKALIKGETDGSSFPTGGLRDIFEARGYTFWDTSSYAYVRGHVLYIPSVFMSYSGDKLDMKLPLLTAKQALSTQATRVLHLLGRKEIRYVEPMLGLEQEYFLVNREEAMKRPDLLYCGRALFSADMPKGGKYQDTYFDHVSEEVSAFMREVNDECWKLGIYASIEHGEAAPGQYEFSSIYTDAITTIDQNLLVMDILQRVAERCGLLCLLHEKPFGGMNGSGKHNNLSLVDSEGDNLFDPGDDTIPNDPIFILFIAAFIEAIDRYPALLRMACSDEGNDHRLGADEAPPAILSIYLGEPLHHLFAELAKTTKITRVQLNELIEPVVNLSDLSIEAADRNRTSPICFTGNKFEFRMLGSSLNASALNTFLFAAIAESLEGIADKLESYGPLGPEGIRSAIVEIGHAILRDHDKILFTGDGYSGTWTEEAQRRGLPNISSYLDTLDVLEDPRTIHLTEHFNVLSQDELLARKAVLIRQFVHSVKTQGRIITRMAQEGIYPALLRYQKLLDQVAQGGRSESAKRRAQRNAEFLDSLDKMTIDLNDLINRIIQEENEEKVAHAMQKDLVSAMERLRDLCNEIELYTPYDLFPYPSQDQLVIQ